MIERLFAFFLMFFMFSCATTSNVIKSEEDNAREEFEEGLKSLKDGYYQEALDKFNQVKLKYPFSRYAVEAELKIGDAYFEDKKYLEAANTYLEFIKLHPTNPLADYAAFRVGLSYFKDAPTDWFFSPPTYEKDQSSNLKAKNAFVDFLDKYKGSKYEKEAKDYLNKIYERLIQHEIYVARFYLNRKKYEASERRLRAVIDKYGKSVANNMDKAFYLLGYSLYMQGKNDDYKEILYEMSSKFPNSKFLRKLRALNLDDRKG